MGDDKSFVESLLKLYKSGKHTDVEFVVGLDKQSFHSHQVVLMARSEVFEAMFSDSWTDGKRKVQIVIPDTESQAFALFLEVRRPHILNRYGFMFHIIYECNSFFPVHARQCVSPLCT